jgi:hypothetical protein
VLRKQIQKKLCHKTHRKSANKKNGSQKPSFARFPNNDLNALLNLLNCLEAPFNQRCPKKKSIAQKLSNFVNRAQCLASSLPKKQQEEQPQTETVVIESQW